MASIEFSPPGGAPLFLDDTESDIFYFRDSNESSAGDVGDDETDFAPAANMVSFQANPCTTVTNQIPQIPQISISQMLSQLTSKYNCSQPPMESIIDDGENSVLNRLINDEEDEKSFLFDKENKTLARNHTFGSSSQELLSLDPASDGENIDSGLTKARGSFDDSCMYFSDQLRQVGPRFDFDKNPTNLYKAMYEKNFDLAENLVKAYPEEASHWVYRKDATIFSLRWIFLPLHAGIICGASLELIQELVEANPASIKAVALDGKLPIHIACESGSDTKVVSYLLEKDPDAIYKKDDFGNIPLQLAILYNKSPQRLQVVQLLYDFALKDHIKDKENESQQVNTAIPKSPKKKKFGFGKRFRK